MVLCLIFGFKFTTVCVVGQYEYQIPNDWCCCCWSDCMLRS